MTRNAQGVQDKRNRLERAGEWLREARRGRGYPSAGDFARALGIDPSAVSRYERGVSEVSDDRAEQIADVLDMDLLDVRRGLGMWVPDGLLQPRQPKPESITERLRRIEQLAREVQQELSATSAPGEGHKKGRDVA